MANLKEYFSLNDESGHIGTVVAMCDATLNSGIMAALEQAFGANVTFPPQVGNDITNEGPKTFAVMVAGEPFEVTISQTWLY